ncbi:MAG: HAD family phosphatase [Sphaerobacter sp.]|nr:HAD family phosphatase [Sphaerobacter sp.]
MGVGMSCAVLFDMDGVLVDSEPVHAAAVADTLAAVGLPPLAPGGYERVFLGRTDVAGFRDYLRELGRAERDLSELLEIKAAAFARRFPHEVRPLADGQATLRALAESGWRVAIISGARAAEIAMVVERFGLGRWVQATVSGDAVPEGKPNPAPYLLGAAHLGVAPADCVVVEDAPAGVQAAKRAGMRCLAVDRTGAAEQLRAAGADQVVREITPAAVTALAGCAGGRPRPSA